MTSTPAQSTRSRSNAAASSTKILGKGSGTVLYITGDTLDPFIASLSESGRDAVSKILRSNIGMQLSQVPFIQEAELAAPDLLALGELCTYASFREGAFVFHQGDDGDKMYIIKSGEVEVLVDEGASRRTKACEFQTTSGLSLCCKVCEVD